MSGDDNSIKFIPNLPKTRVYEQDEKTGHLKHPEVEEWLKESAPGFKPTRQQEKFRKLAYVMAKRKKFFRGEWFRATAKKSYTGVQVNERIWCRWIAESHGFKAWFFDEFPFVEGVSDEEFTMMDQQFWTGIRDGMEEGEEWAYRQYAKTRFDGPGARKSEQESSELKELRGYFDTGGSAAWGTKTGEA